MTGNIVYPAAIVPPGTTWLQEAKHWVVSSIGLEKDALHVYIALILLFGSARLFHWPLRSWKPQALIFAVVMLGEAWDIHDGLETSVPLVVSIPWSVHDIWNTMFWPLAVMALARWTWTFHFLPPRGPISQVSVKNSTEAPIDLFVEIECEQCDLAPGETATLPLAPGPHVIELREGGVTLWNEGDGLAEITKPEPPKP